MQDSPIRVLLIEDDLGDALLVTRRLERELGSLESIRLERATTLAEGIDVLGKRGVDVVLLDLHLPDSAGSDTVRRLREAEATVPIVVFTSSGEGDLPLRALKAGAQDYLGKGDFDTGPLIHRCLRYAIERTRIVEEKQRLQDQLDEAERMQSLGVLGAGAAFGFNQLIGTILDHTDEALGALSEATGPTSARLHLLEARKAALRAIDLAVQLRDYARADRATMRPIDLSDFVSSERAHLEAIAGTAIELELDLETPGPTVLANPLELRQLVFNLVINAGEAIRPTAGRIRVQTGTLWADAELLASGRGAPDLVEGLYTLLSVSDTGPGIDGTTRARIFDPFYTTKFAGRGLGLASALGVVRRHGGWIGAGNDPSGRGARFQVLFPSEKLD
jgi:two-component system, cell cycle sensor histidine kinase and response regulator CckA